MNIPVVHPKNLTDEEILDFVKNNPRATPLEKVLASRFAMALDFIEEAQAVLEANDLIDRTTQWVQ